MASSPILTTGGFTVSWEEVTGKPTVFAPSAHTHTESEITDLDKYTQAEIDALLVLKAAANHDHTGVYSLALHNHDATYLALAGGTMTGSLVGKSLRETRVALSGTTPAVNCNLGNVFTLTLSGNTTLSFSNVPASGIAYACTLTITGGAYTLTWPAAVVWDGGTAPDVPGAGVTAVYTLVTEDNGTTWYAFQAGADMS